MQKKLTQPIRKVMTPGSTVQQQPQQQNSTMQMNAVRKIHSLLQSGTVSVTGMPGTPQRVVQKKPIVHSSSVSITTSNNAATKQGKCYVCGENAISPVLLMEASTATSQTEFTAKIAKMVGGGYTVIVGTEDVVCRRCFNLFNQADKMETDLAVIRTTLTSYINKKYNIGDDDGGHSPPTAKMQKMTTMGGAGSAAGSVTYGIKAQNDADTSEAPVLRKVANVSSASTDLHTDVEAQLSNMFEKPMGGGSASQNMVMVTNNGGNIITTTTSQTATPPIPRRNAIKMYKCVSCDFKTPDLTDFTPHYDMCKQNQQQQQQASTNASMTTATATPSSPMYRCKLCGKIFQTVALLKQHSNLEHQGSNAQQQQGQTDGKSAQTGAPGQLISCNMCTYKTADKQYYDDHLRKHIKLKPFKCRVCLQRFETREQASIHAKNHQPDYFKCGICNVTFNKREQLMKHLETHEIAKKQQPVTKPVPSQPIQQPIPHVPIKMEAALSNADSSTQKLLQDSIDEALSGTVADTIDAKSIQFHSCSTCSLTFLNQSTYSQHMRMHANGNGAGGALLSTNTGNSLASITIPQPQHLGNTAIIRKTTTHNVALGNSLSNTINNVDLNLAGKIVTSSAATGNQINVADGDLESIFEKIHSDKDDSGTGLSNVATSNITFNITLGQQGQDGTTTFVQQQLKPDDVKLDLQQAQPSIGIDMPTLDQGDDQQQQKQQQVKQQQEAMGMSVNMPSLDDDGEQSQNSQNSNTDNVPMELEDMQGVDGQQIKFIVNENGQLLQFTENSQFLTTDADGNQIIVQGADSEQFQQLLQSVGVVMQSGDGLGEGETLQMISGGEGNNQMILVQGADGQEQLIDASLLNADGNIVIQQSQDGELNAEGTHITTEDGLQIPVSVAFTTAGEMDQEGNLTVAMAGGEGAEQQIQLHLQHQGDGDEEDQQHIETGGEQQAILTEGGHIILQAQDQSQQQQQHEQEQQQQQIEQQQQQQQQQQQLQSATEETTADASVANDDEDDACKANGGGATVSSDSTENGTTTGTTIEDSTTASATTSDAPAETEAATAVAATGGTTTAGDEQGMFNFDELIQPQVVVKAQHQQ